MAIVFTGGAANGGGSGTALTVDVSGLTINSGDVVFAVTLVNGSPNVISDNNGGTPFTQVIQEQPGSQSAVYAFWTRVAGASEPSSYAFTGSSSNQWTMLIGVFSGVDTGSIWDVVPTDNSTQDGAASGVDLTCPSMTTSNAGAMGLMIGISDGSGTMSLPQDSYGDEVEYPSNWNAAFYSKIFASSGVTGASGMTMSGTNDWICHQVALKPAAAGTNIDIGLGTMSFIGFALTAALTFNTLVLPDVGAMTYTGFEPTIAISDHQVIPLDVGGLDFNGFEPSISIGNNVSLDVGSLDLTGFEPTITATDLINIDIGLGILTYTGFELIVTITDNQDIDVDVGILTYTGFELTVTTLDNQDIDIDLGVATFTGFAPTAAVTADVFINLDLGVGTFTGFEPTAVATSDIDIDIDVGALTYIGFELVVTLAGIDIGLGILTFTGFEPTIALSNNINIDIGVGALSFIGFVPEKFVPGIVYYWDGTSWILTGYLKTKETTMATATTPLNIAKGLIPGTAAYQKFGLAPDFDTGDGEVDIWCGADDAGIDQMTYVYSSSADIDSISSSDAGDTQDLEITGLDTNYDEVIQTIALTGQTRKALTTSLIRVYRLRNVGATDLAGVAYVYVNGALTTGTPNDTTTIRGLIINGNNQTLMAQYTVPNGKTAYLVSFFGATQGASRTTNFALKLRVRLFGKVFQTKEQHALVEDGTSHFNHKYATPIAYPEKTDIKMTASITAGAVSVASVGAGFEMIIVDD